MAKVWLRSVGSVSHIEDVFLRTSLEKFQTHYTNSREGILTERMPYRDTVKSKLLEIILGLNGIK